MKPVFILAAFILMTHLAVADVHISTTYFVGAETMTNDVKLKNMDYMNEASIFVDQAAATSSGAPRDDTGTSEFSDTVFNAPATGSLKIDAAKLQYSKTIGIGALDCTSFSYSMGSGTAESSAGNEDTQVDEMIFSQNNDYKAVIGATSDGITTSGAGQPTGEGPSSFLDSISLYSNGKHFNIEGQLATSPSTGDISTPGNIPMTIPDAIPDEFLDNIPPETQDQIRSNIEVFIPGVPYLTNIPTLYAWSSATCSGDGFAQGGMHMKASDGKLPLTMTMKGNDGVLPEKEMTGTLKEVTGWYRLSQELYINYMLT
jgi:hypothetical protein